MNRPAWALLAAFLLTAPLAAEAQRGGDVPRIGTLSPSPPTPGVRELWASFFQGLQEHGYVIGKNIRVEQRWAQGKNERLDELAAELVGLPVDVLVTAGILPTRAAKKATGTVPIVMAFGADPVGAGLVTSLAHPGGNVTGIAWQYDELGAKQLELLKEVVPTLSRVAILWNAANPGEALPRVRSMESGARSLGITLERVGVQGSEDLERAFAAMVDRRVEAFLVAGDQFTYLHRSEIATFALRRRLPAAFSLRQYAEVGGLLSYAPNLEESMRHAATHVDKIVKGARPGDLPIERPIKFDLFINSKTAEALGITIPPSLLLRADRIIR